MQPGMNHECIYCACCHSTGGDSCASISYVVRMDIGTSHLAHRRDIIDGNKQLVSRLKDRLGEVADNKKGSPTSLWKMIEV